MAKRQHVVPRNGNWAVKSEGAQRASGIYDTQAKAIEAARMIAKNQHTEVTIHGRNGKIRDSDSFGNDPYPPKDKRH